MFIIPVTKYCDNTNAPFLKCLQTTTLDRDLGAVKNSKYLSLALTYSCVLNGRTADHLTRDMEVLVRGGRL